MRRDRGGTAPGPEALRQLNDARSAERGQTRFYRALAQAAGAAGDVEGEERLNELHADEQHHLARLTARLLELGEPLPPDPPRERAVDLAPWPAWEEEARKREVEEVRRYEALLELGELDPVTRGIVEEILSTERHHARALGGKWVPAEPGGGMG